MPVALNLYVIRKQKGPAGDFFRAVQRQRPAQYQGLYLVAPDGKVLASHQAYKSLETWPQELLADLEPGMTAFGHVQPRLVPPGDPLPGRGVGFGADGGATLAIYLRQSIKRIPIREVPNPTIDSLPLSAKELAELCPPATDAGAAWEVPEALARRFGRMLGFSDENSMPRPHEVTSVKIVGKVQTIENGVAHLVYEGNLAGSHLNQAKKVTHGKATLTGVGRFDVKTGRVLSLLWVLEGIYNGPPPYDQARVYSGVVEWVKDRQ